MHLHDREGSHAELPCSPDAERPTAAVGHELTQACSPEHAAWVARAKFIDKVTSVQDMFNFAKSAEILAAVQVN